MLYTNFCKTSYLMRRSTVLSLSFQLAFPVIYSTAKTKRGYLVCPDEWGISVQRVKAAEVPDAEVLLVALSKRLRAHQVRVTDPHAVRQTVVALFVRNVIKHPLENQGRVPRVTHGIVAVHEWKEPRRAGVILPVFFLQHLLGIGQPALHEAVSLGVVLVQLDKLILILKYARSLAWCNLPKQSFH